MPAHKKWFGPQMEVLETHAKRGLRETDIFRLNLPELEGFSVRAIRARMSVSGLVDPEKSRRIRNAKRLTWSEKEELISFLSDKGINMPDSAVAKKLGVSEQSVFWFRRKEFGKVVGGRRYLRGTEESRRKKISATAAYYRQKRYEELCQFQTDLEKSRYDCPMRVCKTCGVKRFLDTRFFYRASDGVNFFRDCIICQSEKSVLKHAGYTSDEIRDRLSKLFRKRPTRTIDELLDLAAFHRRVHKGGLKTRTCQHCRMVFLDSWQYFHQRLVGQTHICTDTCLACPYDRRFFSQ